jgi:thermostable 8-oxoguanine DNA glycosylase
MQRGAVFLPSAVVNLDFPAAHEEVLPGVPWGGIDCFPSPAYWAYQVLARRVHGTQVNYKLGNTLKEEVCACLLGGHGIPAGVGIDAFEHLKRMGAFTLEVPTEQTLLGWLSEPIPSEGRLIRYRFARQKAKYLAAALRRLDSEPAPTSSGRQLRDWLLEVPGIGYKTASWIARNWLDADDVAILDIHILRAGLLGGFFEPSLTVERDYLKLEEQFLKLSQGLGVRSSELDALMWLEMMSSGTTIQALLEYQPPTQPSADTSISRRSPKKRHTDSGQLSFLG